MVSIVEKLKRVDLKEDFITWQFYLISHPFKGFGELKYENRGKPYFAVVMLFLACLFSICDELYKGFVLSGGYFAEDKIINTPYIIFMTLAPIALFVAGNWSITSITDGNGKMKDIFLVYAYASYPKLWLDVTGLIISNIVTGNEAAFATFFYTFGTVAFVFYLFVGLIVIHEYSFTQAVRMILFTVAAMCIIVFVLALFLSLANEVFVFFKTIYREITLRL